MKRNESIRRSTITTCLAGLMMTALASGQTPLDEAFTYQGRLVNSGLPANGSFDLEFRLFDAPTAGNQIGIPIALPGEPVAGGLFTVLLNSQGEFGSGAFNGEARWLEVRVDGIPLAPRQELTVAPYTIRAVTSNNSLRLNGETADYYQNASNLNSGTLVPARLPPEAARRDLANTFLANNTFQGSQTSIVSPLSLGSSSPPLAALHVRDGSYGGAGYNSTTGAIFERDDSCFLQVLVPENREAGMLFGTPTNGVRGAMIFSDTGLFDLRFRTENINRVTIEADGDVGIGTTLPAERLHVAGNFLTSGSFSSAYLQALPALDTGTNATANIRGGYVGNIIGPGVAGATITGGGRPGFGGSGNFFQEALDDYAFVGGGYSNKAGNGTGTTDDAAFAVVVGGLGNEAIGQGSAVLGGKTNHADGSWATVAGGEDNRAETQFSTIAGGSLNRIFDPTPGIGNGGINGFVGGGNTNQVSGAYGAIVGGRLNQVMGSDGFIGGGFSNEAALEAVVGGGAENAASGIYSAIGGGESNTASGSHASIGGGELNTAAGDFAAVSGGLSNDAMGDKSVIGGGSVNTALGNEAVVSGGLSNDADADQSTIGGGARNHTTALTSTIAGGADNTASDFYAFVGGGWTNTAGGQASVVSGGQNNAADGDWATVAGGHSNAAAGNYSFAAGQTNSAGGIWSSVPGGHLNNAGGDYSLAAGRRAKVRTAAQSGDSQGDEGTFVWSDTTNSDFISTGPDQFLIRATGGVGIGTNSPLAPLHVREGSSGATVGSNRVAIFERNTSAFINVLTPTASESGILFGNPTGSSEGALVFNDSGGQDLRFRTQNTNRMTITSAGLVGINTTAPTSTLHVAGTVTATTVSATTITAAVKNFSIDHPLDPENKLLVHASVESDEYKNLYDGVVTTDKAGYATVTLPEWFEALNENFRYQLTIIDEADRGDVPLWARVVGKLADNRFTIRTSHGGVEVSWQVTGTRRDEWALQHPMRVEQPKLQQVKVN